jgi:hypothetical protein
MISPPDDIVCNRWLEMIISGFGAGGNFWLEIMIPAAEEEEIFLLGISSPGADDIG